jgi:hypothetical protein
MGCGSSTDSDARRESAVEEKKRLRREEREKKAFTATGNMGEESEEGSASTSLSPASKYGARRESNHWAPVAASPTNKAPEPAPAGSPQGAWSPQDESLGSAELYKVLMQHTDEGRGSGQSPNSAAAQPRSEDGGGRPVQEGGSSANTDRPNALDEVSAVDTLIPTQE